MCVSGSRVRRVRRGIAQHRIAAGTGSRAAGACTARACRLPSMLLLRVSDRIKNFFVLLYYYYVLCASPHAFTRARHPAPVRTTLGLRMHGGLNNHATSMSSTTPHREKSKSSATNSASTRSRCPASTIMSNVSRCFEERKMPNSSPSVIGVFCFRKCSDIFLHV